MQRPLNRLLALVLGGLIALLGAELLLRAREAPDAYRIWTPGLRQTFRPRAELMPGVSGPSRFEVSSLGFRGGERPDDVELSILALGGSTTECLYLDQDECWPAQVERELAQRLGRRVWVANAGRSGRTASDHVLQLDHLLRQEPHFELVLVLAGVNDLCAWLAADGVPSPASSTLERAFDRLPSAAVGGPWWRRTALVRGLSALRARWSASAVAQDPEGAVYARWRENRSQASAWRDELPPDDQALTRFRANLEELVTLCLAHGSRPVLLSQPALWALARSERREELLWMGGVGDYQVRAGAPYYTAEALARGLARFNAVVAEVAHAHGQVFLDLARSPAAAQEAFYDDVHFNEEGARRAAAFVTAGLAAALGD